MTAVSKDAIAGLNAQYDAEAKKLLSQGPILARILRRCMHELEGLSVEEVESRIESVPQVGEVPVDPGLTNTVRTASEENSVAGEGRVTFDIRTSVVVPGEEGPVSVIVNVEAQRDFHPGYDMVSRGIVYVARLLSSQVGVEVTHSHYDQLKKVYSIWVCMNVPEEEAGAIATYSFSKRDLLGSLPDRPEAYDKAEVVLVTLSRGEGTGDELVDMLSLLLSKQIERQEKLDRLGGRYNVKITSGIAEGVNVMCNLGEAIADEAMQKGIEQGMQQGMQQGIEQGRSGQLAEQVAANLRAGRRPEEFADFLGLTVEQAEEIARGLSTVA